MVVLRQSQTCPVNPDSASPKLTLAQLWEVMQYKVRSPEVFVAAMEASEVLEETPTFVKRNVTFKEGMGPPGGQVTEDLQIRAPWKVDFYNLNTGAFINNTVSQGKDDMDLYLTFYFEWPFPDIGEGSKEEKERSEQLWGQARKTVQHTIDVARDMLKEGKLKS